MTSENCNTSESKGTNEDVDNSNKFVSLGSLVGSNSALSTAFKDLKKRYIITQLRCNQYKNQTISMGVQLEHTSSKLNVKDKRINHLEECLTTKTTAYNNLELAHKVHLDTEANLMNRISEIECLLEENMLKYESLLKENRKLNVRLEKLSEKLADVLKEKQEVEEELTHLKNIPEICIHDNSCQSSTNIDVKENSDENINIASLKKQIHNLSSEKQTLKTNIHWLTLELEKEKAKNNENISKRTRNLSETLEEACGTPVNKTLIPQADFQEKNVLQCASYLQDMLRELETTLQCYNESQNREVEDERPALKFSNSFVNVENIENFKDILQKDDVCAISLHDHVDDDSENLKSMNSSELETLMFEFSIDELPKLDEPFLDGENSITGDLSKSFSNDLPYPLFDKVHLLQTQIHLKSKTTVADKNLQ